MDTRIQRKNQDAEGIQVQMQVRDETNGLNVTSKVYKFADMLRMEDLEKIASARCQGSLSVSWRSPGFRSVLKTLFESAGEEADLRFQTTILLAKNDQLFNLVEETLKVLLECTPKLRSRCCEVLDIYHDTQRRVQVSPKVHFSC